MSADPICVGCDPRHPSSEPCKDGARVPDWKRRWSPTCAACGYRSAVVRPFCLECGCQWQGAK